MPSMTEQSLTLTMRETADALRVSIRTLQRWAKADIGPRQIPFGLRLVRYDATEVRSFQKTGGQ